LHALDGVRAVAASLVILHHIGATTAADNLTDSGHKVAGALLLGATAGGVELFFVLSGVVLARPYLRDKRPMSLTSYFSRRVKRLYPPFFVAWLIAGLTALLVSNFPTWWSSKSTLPNFQLRDWLEQAGIIYWGDRLYNYPTWSLSTEMVFYLIFPFLILLFRPIPTHSLLTIPFFVISILASIFASFHPLVPLTVFNYLIVYSSCFCGGMLLAAVDFKLTARCGLAIAGATWVVCAAYRDAMNAHVGWGLLAVALVSSASDSTTNNEHVLSKPLFVWLGERSYSLFLTHGMVIYLVYEGVSSLTPRRGAVYLLVSRLVAIPLILFTAMLLFHLVERRFARNLVTADAFWPWSKTVSNRAVPISPG
jgi:peptidoglycan/LPS O-acetylase OafA/YrhL